MIFSKKEELDIEDMVSVGQNHHICPYYSTKTNLEYADIICLPYSTLISKPTRKALDLDLTHSVILFDEAHNLAEQFSSLNTVKVTTKELSQCFIQVKKYLKRYEKRLKKSNKGYLEQILGLLSNFLKIFYSAKFVKKVKEEVTATELLIRSKALEYDLGRLRDFIEGSDLSRKLVFFSIWDGNRGNEGLELTEMEKKMLVGVDFNPGKGPKSSEFENQLFSVEKFINFIFKLFGGKEMQARVVLAYRDNVEGIRGGAGAYFFPMELKNEFEEIVDNCSAVLFTGGTMQPAGLLHQILDGSGKELVEASFPHVVPQNQIFLSKQFFCVFLIILNEFWVIFRGF